jgi:hypothetical protein
MSVIAISWSGGVPSTGLVAPSIAGLLPRAEVAAFAETYSETESTYRTLRAWRPFIQGHDMDAFHFFGKPLRHSRNPRVHGDSGNDRLRGANSISSSRSPPTPLSWVGFLDWRTSPPLSHSHSHYGPPRFGPLGNPPAPAIRRDFAGREV